MSALGDAILAAEKHQARLAADLVGRRADLPLRYWRQQAHFTTPAADGPMARKAVEGGTAPMARIMNRFAVSPEALAEHLMVAVADVEMLLAQPRRAPLVILDGEDAQALRDDVTAAGLEATAAILLGADWTGHGPASLRFFRPPGFALVAAARDLYTLLWGLAEGSSGGRLPLDGIVFPKIEHPEEVGLLYRLLDRAESDLGLPPGSIRVGLLIESGWAAARLSEIALAAAPRLCSLILGIADFSADIGLPAIANDHAVADWLRAEIVTVAGAVGVPAIDAMTLDYPVADPSLDTATNRGRFLDRMALVHADAVRAREFGMLGKWVGHPAQLFAVLLAFDAGFHPDRLEIEAKKLETYRRSVDVEGRGATIIDGVMSDRATDRHARAVLRQATALGRFEPARALGLGVISAAEYAEFQESTG